MPGTRMWFGTGIKKEEKTLKQSKVWKRFGAMVLTFAMVIGTAAGFPVTVRAAAGGIRELGQDPSASRSYPERVGNPD